jgi:hypothetical protein
MSDKLTKAAVLFEAGVDKGLITKSGSWYKFGEVTLGQKKEDVIAVIESNNEIFNQLDTAVGSKPSIVVGANPVSGEQDIENLGVKKHVLTKSVAVPLGGENLGRDIMEIKDVEVVQFLEQPIIDVTGAKILGTTKEHWHLYPYSTVVNGVRIEKGRLMTYVPKTGRWKDRRFMMFMEEYQKL